MSQSSDAPERININNLVNCAHWAKKLSVSDEQLLNAIQVVGNRATDVEMHLKGSRSTTNADRMQDLPGA